jgi:prepilin-type processing-associated H-X9-DG protein
MPIRSRSSRRAAAFSLVELITVIGILAILMALLLPSLIEARKAARTVQCASNLRQLTTALINYSVEWRGNFPPNSNQIEQYWFNSGVLGRYIKSAIPMPDNTIAGGVLVCPSDLEGAIRSYSVNFFTSSYVSDNLKPLLEGPNPPGKMFKSGAAPGSNLILAIESFSAWEAPGHEPRDVPAEPVVGYTTNAIVGFRSGTPAQRFGADGGAPFAGGRFGDTTVCQVAYFRHRNVKTVRLITDAFGRVNIGFADGHVATCRHDELADFSTGKSRYLAMWSPIDREIDIPSP